MGPLNLALFRRRDVLGLIFLVVLALSTLSLFSHPPQVISTTHIWPRPGSNQDQVYQPAIIPQDLDIAPEIELEPLEVLAQLYEDERISLLAGYDQADTEALIRTPSGALDPDFNNYISRLERFVNTWFEGSSAHYPLTQMLSRLVTAHPPPEQESEFEKTLYSLDKGGGEGVPDEFGYWSRRLGGEGWDIKVGDDMWLEEWFRDVTDQPSHFSDGQSGHGAELWKEMWEGLGRPVLKSDLLRYLLMLLKGGMYTDSDTAPLSDPFLWGTHAKTLTPPSLRTLQRAMRHLDSTHPTTLDTDYASNPIPEAALGINNPRVSMVISVEYDVHHPRQDPRFGYTRDLQIVQWTFMAKPFHPIFLDVLERATDEIMTRRETGDGKVNWQSVLDVTGPGPFTDAVLRYLLVQYGVTPQDLLGMEDGALVGDVLILPLHAFGSYLGGEEEWNAEDPSTRCVAHGFRGRWKADSSFERRSRR